MGYVTVFSGKTAAVAAPTTASDGTALWKGSGFKLGANEGFNEDGLAEAELSLYETAYTSGVPAIAYGRLWGMLRLTETTFKWIPIGQGTGAAGASTDKGRLNSGAAIDGPTGTTLRHSERVSGLREFERIAVETGAFTGVFTLECRLSNKVVR